MLVITRKAKPGKNIIRMFVAPGDKPQAIEVEVRYVNRGTVKLAIEAGPEVRIVRGELKDQGDSA